MAARWDRHLTRNQVPSKRLQQVYDRAVDIYDNKSPFSVFHLLAAWDQIRTEERVPQRRAPEQCDYEHLDEEKKLVELVFVGSQREATLPCPVCLPAEFNAARKAMVGL